jgi:hypothetical protein
MSIHKLVNLSDPNHPFARMVSQTPNLLDKILAHPKPAQYALEIAQNQRMGRPNSPSLAWKNFVNKSARRRKRRPLRRSKHSGKEVPKRTRSERCGQPVVFYR